MGRRSDHSREELRVLAVNAGQTLLAETGLARFSARSVAKSVGYTVGTISNIFGNVDGLVLAINTKTFSCWTDYLVQALAACGPKDDRIAVLVKAYFDFAAANTNLWLAIFDHRRPDGMILDDDDIAERAKLTGLIDVEVARFLKCKINIDIQRLTRSLIATVHGHCVLAMGGSFALMGERDPCGQAIARVHDALRAAKSAPKKSMSDQGKRNA